MYTVGSRKLWSVFIAINFNGSINKIEENWEKNNLFHPRWRIFVYKLNVGSSAITHPVKKQNTFMAEDHHTMCKGWSSSIKICPLDSWRKAEDRSA